jgi:hypothetical protein
MVMMNRSIWLIRLEKKEKKINKKSLKKGRTCDVLLQLKDLNNHDNHLLSMLLQTYHSITTIREKPKEGNKEQRLLTEIKKRTATVYLSSS